MTAADLIFDEPVHQYRLPDGTLVPSVTEILSATGVATDFDELSAMSQRLGAAIEDKRALGQALHKDAWAYDDQDLIWSTVDPRVEPYLRAWAKFRENSQLEPLTRERRVYSPIYRYAGTLDGIFLHPDGRRILVDIKTSATVDPAARLQVAAYAMAWGAEHPDDLIPARWIVQLTPDRAVPYRIVDCSAGPDTWMDGQKFLACVTVFGLQAARRKERAA